MARTGPNNGGERASRASKMIDALVVTEPRPRQLGRPTRMNEWTKDQLLERIKVGRSVRSICRDDDMPDATTVFRYLAGKSPDHASFRQRYAEAVEFRTYFLAELALDVAMDESEDYEEREDKNGNKYTVLNPTALGRARIIVEELHWHIERLNPTKYGRVEARALNNEIDQTVHVNLIDYRELPDEPVKDKRAPNLTIDPDSKRSLNLRPVIDTEEDDI